MTIPLAEPARIDVTTGSQISTIWVGHGIVDELGARLDRHGVGGKRFIVSSPRIWKHHGARLQAALGEAPGGPTEPILIPDGERYKTLASVSKVYDALIRGGADRGSTPPARPASSTPSTSTGNNKGTETRGLFWSLCLCG